MRIRLPLDGQQSVRAWQEDCSNANAVLHARVDETATTEAVQRALARAAAYEAAERSRPTICLPMDEVRFTTDCSGANAVLHARAASGVHTVLRGLATAGAYEVADLLDGLEQPAYLPPSAPNPLLTLSLTLWRDVVARSSELPSVEAIVPCTTRMQYDSIDQEGISESNGCRLCRGCIDASRAEGEACVGEGSG